MNGFDYNSSPIIVGDGLRKYMMAVYNKMFLALCITGVVSFACISNQTILRIMASGFSFVLMLATFGIVFYLSARINRIDSDKAGALFWLYSALIGAFFSPLFVIYTGESIANSFFMTAVFFGGMSLYGYVTKRDLTSIGSFMTVGLFAVIITSLINMFFLKSSALQIGISALTIVIFCGLTAYDVQRIRMFYDPSLDEETLKKRSILGSLTLYLDFINMFIAILRILGSRRD